MLTSPAPHVVPLADTPAAPPDEVVFRPARLLGAEASNGGHCVMPVDVAVARDGTLLVLDAGRHDIVRFDAQSLFRDRIGHRGTEPGALGTALRRVLLDAEDTILVPDPSLHRVDAFAPNGDALPPLPLPESVHPALGFAIGPGGRLQRAELVQRLVVARGHRLVPHVVVTTLPADMPWCDGLLPTGTGPQRGLYAESPAWTADAEGCWIASNETGEVLRFDEQYALRDVWCFPRGERGSRVAFGPRYPRFSRLLVGEDGALWVNHALPSRRGSGESHGSSALWDVHERSGAFRRRVRVPPGFTLTAASEERLVGVGRGPEGERVAQILERLRAA